MTMWIVLGSLIGVVLIFLITTSLVDRKKSIQMKLEKKSLDKEVIVVGKKISDKIKIIIKDNEKTLKNFVPSVGEFKMSDINKRAKESLKDIKDSRDFKLLTHEPITFKKFDVHIKNMIKEKSNNWQKRNIEDIKFFNEYKPPAPKVEVDTKKKKKGKK